MISQTGKKRAPRNKTITLTESEQQQYQQKVMKLTGPVVLQNVLDKTINDDLIDILDFLPSDSVDLMIADPPYNLHKSFNQTIFHRRSHEIYEAWLDSWLLKIVRLLKPNASLYMCGDWRSSISIYKVLEKYFRVRNRITWEREKGRGSKKNWKNCLEDIWFCTMSNRYTFNLDAVKIRRKVLAPYKDRNGFPKDWRNSGHGGFRITCPSNVWTDISVPFWSMPENTIHPTQKPEKLIAKLILASSNEHDVVFDPFLGSGTTSVVSKKLDRRFIGVEIDAFYCCLTEKRLEMVRQDKTIQGYSDGYFWERNTCAQQYKEKINAHEINHTL